MPLIIRNIAFIVIGLYFFINGLASGNPASIVIGAGLGAIAVYVALGGKVHKKFQRKATMDSKTSDDDELSEFVGKLKGLAFGAGKDPAAPTANTSAAIEAHESDEGQA